MEAAVTESRNNRTGTAVPIFKAIAGSSEVATLAAAALPQAAVTATSSPVRDRHNDRAAILDTRGKWEGREMRSSRG